MVSFAIVLYLYGHPTSDRNNYEPKKTLPVIIVSRLTTNSTASGDFRYITRIFRRYCACNVNTAKSKTFRVFRAKERAQTVRRNVSE